MLARVDTETGTVHLVSVPRDMMVEIEDHGTQKINAALAFGGPAGAVRALSAFAGVPITHYVELRFEQLVELVDRLGGVTVDVPEGFTSDTSGITLAAGTQTLNGEEAPRLRLASATPFPRRLQPCRRPAGHHLRHRR